MTSLPADRPLEGLPPLPWHVETAAMLYGLAQWVDDELNRDKPPKWVAQKAADCARYIAERPVTQPPHPAGPVPQLPAGGHARTGWLALNVRKIREAGIFRDHGDGWWTE